MSCTFVYRDSALRLRCELGAECVGRFSCPTYKELEKREDAIKQARQDLQDYERSLVRKAKEAGTHVGPEKACYGLPKATLDRISGRATSQAKASEGE